MSDYEVKYTPFTIDQLTDVVERIGSECLAVLCEGETREVVAITSMPGGWKAAVSIVISPPDLADEEMKRLGGVTAKMAKHELRGDGVDEDMRKLAQMDVEGSA